MRSNNEVEDLTIQPYKAQIDVNSPGDRVLAAAQRLVEFREKIYSGNYDTQTLYDYGEAYGDYVRADLMPTRPTWFQRIKERISFWG